MSQPRPEHPRPQFERDSWINLNGEWTFERPGGPVRYRTEPTVPSKRNQERVPEGPFDQSITVPFAPESELSGVGTTEFIERITYHRRAMVPADWQGKLLFLRFGGVDFHTDVYVNGAYVGSHSGGSAPFSFEITRFAQPGNDADIVVAVQDDIHSGNQPGGKQSHRAHSWGCFYTRTTGIWQTVWMEAIAPGGLADVQIITRLDGTVTVVPRFHRTQAGAELLIRCSSGVDADRETEPCAEVRGRAVDGLPVTVAIDEPKLWWPDDPHLYTLEFSVFVDGEEIDRVQSYTGVRETQQVGGRVYLNGKSLFLRFVLDQGFYPDGIWTAPSDAALRRDIELSMAAGFNGARLHQKVFEDRFHYWADRLGYLTWSEWASWGFDYNSYDAARAFLTEVADTVAYLRNHPSIVAWTPFNETWDLLNKRSHYINHTDAYRLCKQIDPSRPVNDSSGAIHHVTDLYTVHTYQPDGEKLAEMVAPGPNPHTHRPDVSAPLEGQPYIVDEFGGIKWDGKSAEQDLERRTAWGYGDAPATKEAFFARLEGQIAALNGSPLVAGWCYTQLTDVEQEQNGVYFYDRSDKFDLAEWRKHFSWKPESFEL